LRTILSKKKFADRCGISVRHLERLNSLGEPRLFSSAHGGSESPKTMAKLGSPRVALCRRDGATQQQRFETRADEPRGIEKHIFRDQSAPWQ
jgi:hypothetical protein